MAAGDSNPNVLGTLHGSRSFKERKLWLLGLPAESITCESGEEARPWFPEDSLSLTMSFSSTGLDFGIRVQLQRHTTGPVLACGDMDASLRKVRSSQDRHLQVVAYDAD